LSGFANCLAAYLSLTPSQVEAIQQVMIREQHTVESVMSGLRTSREKRGAISSEPMTQNQVNSLGDTEASPIARPGFATGTGLGHHSCGDLKSG